MKFQAFTQWAVVVFTPRVVPLVQAPKPALLPLPLVVAESVVASTRVADTKMDASYKVDSTPDK